MSAIINARSEPQDEVTPLHGHGRDIRRSRRRHAVRRKRGVAQTPQKQAAAKASSRVPYQEYLAAECLTGSNFCRFDSEEWPRSSGSRFFESRARAGTRAACFRRSWSSPSCAPAPTPSSGESISWRRATRRRTGGRLGHKRTDPHVHLRRPQTAEQPQLRDDRGWLLRLHDLRLPDEGRLTGRSGRRSAVSSQKAPIA